MRKLILTFSFIPVLLLLSCSDDEMEQEQSIIGTWRCIALEEMETRTTVFPESSGQVPITRTEISIGQELDYTWDFSEDGIWTSEGSYVLIVESTTTSEDLAEPFVSMEELPVDASFVATYTFGPPTLTLIAQVPDSSGGTLDTIELDGEVTFDGDSFTITQIFDVNNDQPAASTSGSAVLNSTWTRE